MHTSVCRQILSASAKMQLTWLPHYNKRHAIPLYWNPYALRTGVLQKIGTCYEDDDIIQNTGHRDLLQGKNSCKGKCQLLFAMHINTGWYHL